MSLAVGQKLKYFRKRAGLSQLDLGTEAHMAEGSVSRMENGLINPSKETIFKIADLLKLNPRELDYITGITAEPATPEEVKKSR